MTRAKKILESANKVNESEKFIVVVTDKKNPAVKAYWTGANFSDRKRAYVFAVKSTAEKEARIAQTTTSDPVTVVSV